MVHSSKSKESTRYYQKYLTSPPPTTSYDQETLSSPPRSDSTKGQLDIESPCSNEESPCINDGCVSMITDFERPIPSSNPPPKQHTPTVPLLRPKSPPRQYLVSARSHHPKSPPRPDSTKGQLDIESPCSNEESPCINDGCISMITDFERPIPSSNPPPKQHTPTVPLLRPKSPPRQYLVSARSHHPKSPPRPDSTKGLLDIESPSSNEESPCINDGCISMITDFERPIPSSNPPPKQQTPTVPLLRPKSPPRQYLVSARNHHPWWSLDS